MNERKINVFKQVGSLCLNTLDVMQFKENDCYQYMFISVEVIVDSVICCDLKGQHISIAQKKCDHISKLPFVNFEDENKTFPVFELWCSISTNFFIAKM